MKIRADEHVSPKIITAVREVALSEGWELSSVWESGHWSHTAMSVNLDSLDEHDVEIDMPLDVGIRRYVLILRAQGIETFESCEGGAGHSFPEPTVRFHGNACEGYRAYAAAANYGLPVKSLRRYYDVIEGQLDGPRWEMTFNSCAGPST